MTQHWHSTIHPSHNSQSPSVPCPTDKHRIRENQRRSRARKSQLLQDLQARVLAYEREGVSATQEVQYAARRVALENERLRTLLARYGVMKREVDGYLRSFGEEETEWGGSAFANVPPRHASEGYREGEWTGRDGASNSLRPITTQHQQSQPCERQFGLPHPPLASFGGSYPPHVPTESSLHATYIREPPSPPSSTNRQNCKLSPTTPNQPPVISPERQSHMQSRELDCPNSLTCFCAPSPPPPAIPAPPPSSGLEISCEDAARIIADMRGSGGVDQRDVIRASLGCGTREERECKVKNSVVLQIMSEK
ncbi:unnamed protein product [Periconia digitata]|uniref:BZIP domain-containing protein n=1 Tax=Periconia digitata TaxID=1303443 RepID=A0A9W4UHK5_9PLEO|nr:unnamed protein product [Periconia digitata]